MSGLSREELKNLALLKSVPCVSLFMPTHRTMPDTLQDRIRLTNLLKRAAKQIEQQHGTSSTHILDRAFDLAENTSFWEYQMDGLALFISHTEFKIYNLPVVLREEFIVSTRFYLKPLLRILANDGKFFVLALSQKNIRLMECTSLSCRDVDLADIPKNLEGILRYDESGDAHRHAHPGDSSHPARGPMAFHGEQNLNGGGDHKDDILRFFREVEKGLRNILKGEQAPLILAGVEYLLPIYRAANSYPHLSDDAITGNPEGWNPQQLHTRALQHMRRMFDARRESATRMYREMARNQRTSNTLEEIIPAAEYGRVEFLFVADGTEQWGTFNPQTKNVEKHITRWDGDDDLLDVAARETFLNNGFVFAVQPDEIPDHSDIAAIYRY